VRTGARAEKLAVDIAFDALRKIYGRASIRHAQAKEAFPKSALRLFLGELGGLREGSPFGQVTRRVPSLAGIHQRSALFPPRKGLSA
jgi:hypothetical protein